MQIIDLRQDRLGWVADIVDTDADFTIQMDDISYMLLDDYEVLNLLIEYANSDPAHVAIYDPRLPIDRDMDILEREWKETYRSLL